MLPADMIEKKDARGNIRRFVETPSKKRYLIGKLFNSGGVGQVYLSYQKDNNGNIVQYVIKEYPKPETPGMRDQQRNIRKNLKTLIDKPLHDNNNQPLASMVPPLELVDFPNTGTFGYVMNYVDLSDYKSVGEMLHSYPDIDIVCRLAKNICHFFDILAQSAGYCYKDINEGNIYLNLITGEVRIIDNDNVGDPGIVTISGTGYYMAPEVQTGQKNPDRQTDRFSLAAYLLRMFTGARPYEGAKAIQYACNHNQNVYDAAPVIFGSDAVFIFDPNDKSNSIRKYPFTGKLTSDQEKERKGWKNRCLMWDLLPGEMQDAFIATFSEGVRLENVNKRTTARKWYELFDKLEKSTIRCPHCHRMTFGTAEKCFFCEREIHQILCKSCGQKTPKSSKVCLHCGNPPGNAPKKTVKCPHCNTPNSITEHICSNCHKYITVTCHCATTNTGTSKICSSCGATLYKVCPSCNNTVAMTEKKCPYCKHTFAKVSEKCTSCGRQIYPGENECRFCHVPFNGSPLPVTGSESHKLKLDVTIRDADGLKNGIIEHTFPSGSVYYADNLSRKQKSRPLFKLKFNARQNVYALQNVSGGQIWYKDAQNTQNELENNAFAFLQPGMQFKFDNSLILKIKSMNPV